MAGFWILVALFVCACVVAVPLGVIIVLARTSRLQRALEEQQQRYDSAISALRGEVSDVRRALAQVPKQAAQQSADSSVAPTAAAQEPKPAPAPVAPATQKPTPIQAPPVPEPPMPAVAAPVASLPSQPVVAVPPVARPEPLTPRVEPVVIAAASALSSEIKPAAPPPSTPAAPVIQVKVEPPAKAAQQAVAAARTAVASYAPLKTAPPRKGVGEQLRSTLPLEEALGMNLFAKIGIVLLVLGFALLGRVALIAMGPAGKVALLYAVAAALLGGGIWLEGKERYRLVGRTGIGGGWALLFFTTYAMHHVPAMLVMGSETLNCEAMLFVAIAMVAHTLRYQSQLVTGLSFLLAFSTIALSQETVYALTAGAILAAGIVAVSLRMSWFELEIFGILATYLNHLYWLYKLYPSGVAGHPFPQFWLSAGILILYWLTFRISYVARTIRNARDEHVSTVAALVNTSLLLAVMRFQSTHPEFAFYALLVLGALEFFFGQLPATRRRRSAFIILTVLGTTLMFMAVPFRFSGNNIALLWMIAAEVLLAAGIVQAEVVFRRLGLLTGLFTGLLIAYEAIHIIEFRQHSEAPLLQDCILLLTCSALFYLNALLVRQKWPDLFETLDGKLATCHSYLGGLTAFIGMWGVFTGEWTAVAWAALMLGTALGVRKLANKHLLLQGWILALAVAIRALGTNCDFSLPYPHHVTSRLITLPVLSLLFYLTATVLSGAEDARRRLRSFTLWVGSSLLVALAWLDVTPVWVAVVWMAFAVTLALIGGRFKLGSLCYQEHLLALFVVLQLLSFNLDATTATERYLPFVACAAALYAISRFCTLRDAGYRKIAAWTHTWAATVLLAALAWNVSPQLWLAPIWAVFALALAVVDRVFEVEELPYQTHVLAALAAMRAITLNVFSAEKWHNLDLRLITLSIVVIVMYALARWVRIPQSLRERDVHHVYSWIGSFIAAWMLWSELQPIGVAVGIALFGLVLFEWGMLQQQKQLRLQAYVALTVAFVRIFFVNLTAAPAPGETISPRVYTVVPIALICFFVWAQLQYEKGKIEAESWSAGSIVAYFGTGCIAALIYFQAGAELIVAAWAVLVLALMVAALALDREVFLQQATLLTLGIMVRGFAYNIYGGSYFTSAGWHGNFTVIALTAALLFGTLPIAFRLRGRCAGKSIKPASWYSMAFEHPEQLLFFAPIVLITLMIAAKMDPGMVTLAWGVEGVLVIVLGLAVGQRSYRLTGLFLLLLCVGKIVFRDAWLLGERDRYITFIVLGASISLVPILYGRYRESIRRLL